MGAWALEENGPGVRSRLSPSGGGGWGGGAGIFRKSSVPASVELLTRGDSCPDSLSSLSQALDQALQGLLLVQGAGLGE